MDKYTARYRLKLPDGGFAGRVSLGAAGSGRANQSATPLLWQTYYDALEPLAKAGRIELPTIPADCIHNAHMFYIKLRDNDDRSKLIAR